ncbi:peptidoglycan-binding protein LysM [Flavobacterium sp.]|uniref:peptidoglycan-binding protein LysM n=1 Tax=Flavobacterium sp. TaxID=239 RepID=UPI0025E1E9E7|nr:peptidoglycan-binding protein LysM [Flavobacterium sp.]
MIKKGIFYTAILLTVAFLSSGFKPYNSQISNFLFADENEEQSYVFPSQNNIDYFKLKIPFTGKYFIGFKEAVAHKESQGKYRKINSLGYMGKYQFGKETLKSIGIKDSVGFMNNPKLQEKAFVALLSKNKYDLKDYIHYYDGKIVDGVKITESGILAAAHLGGSGSVKRFLNSNGEKKCKDDYGTSVKTYMKDFGGFETVGIRAVKNAKVK